MTIPVIDINETNFDSEVLHSSQPVLLNCWSNQGMVASIVEFTLVDVALEYAGRLKWRERMRRMAGRNLVNPSLKTSGYCFRVAAEAEAMG